MKKKYKILTISAAALLLIPIGIGMGFAIKNCNNNKNGGSGGSGGDDGKVGKFDLSQYTDYSHGNPWTKIDENHFSYSWSYENMGNIYMYCSYSGETIHYSDNAYSLVPTEHSTYFDDSNFDGKNRLYVLRFFCESSPWQENVEIQINFKSNKVSYFFDLSVSQIQL